MQKKLVVMFACNSACYFHMFVLLCWMCRKQTMQVQTRSGKMKVKTEVSSIETTCANLIAAWLKSESKSCSLKRRCPLLVLMAINFVDCFCGRRFSELKLCLKLFGDNVYSSQLKDIFRERRNGKKLVFTARRQNKIILKKNAWQHV